MIKSKIASKKDSELYVVGVGASAGGLDALTKFLKNFNGGKTDICIVIVIHLSPDYKSQLAQILDKHCKWPVISVKDGMEVNAGHVYVTPQNKQIRILKNKLILEDLLPKQSFTPSIDNFFTSLAEDKTTRAIGIILSGFGKDGSLGISSIHNYGGLTVAQLPETTEHRDMPTAAIASGHIDLILPAEQMFDDITQYITNSHTIGASSTTNKNSADAIFDLLEKRSGTDFSIYKPTTIMRRIKHRINSLQLGSILEYYEAIKENPNELDKLFDSLLIGVTEFFRDTEAFGHLRTQLKEMLKDKEPGDSIRIWSVGCATGEEPYSIAILLFELLGKEANNYHIQIFASDIDERAIDFGRKAIYHQDTLANLPTGILEKYFDKKDKLHYEINKENKQHILFTKHDITNDPPFVKLDMVVCRNLLIYFNTNLQKQTFQIFHYSLKPKGILFLGKSESVGVAADLFNKVGKEKIFRKADNALNYQLKFSRFNSQTKQIKEDKNKDNIRNMSIVDVAKETLYYKHYNPFVIINDASEIKEVHGSLRLYMEIGQGAMNINLSKMVNPELTTVVKGLHIQVKKTGVAHTSHVVKFKLYNQLHFVRIKIIPLVYQLNEVQYYIVIFEKIEPSEGHLELQKKLETSDFVNLRIKDLEAELTSAKEQLQIFTEELESTNEELQTINEELQSSNEELKSSNEELETGNEELQSANEELNTANQELRLANDMLIEKEKELKEEKNKTERNKIIFQTIADNIPNGSISILNKDFEIEYIGGKYLEENNQEKENFLGKKYPDLNPSPKEQKKLVSTLNKTLKGESCAIEVNHEENTYSIHTMPYKLAFEDSTKIMCLVQDITQIKKDSLKYKVSLEAANMVILEYDFAKKIFLPNPYLSKLLNLKTEKAIPLENVENVLFEEGKKQLLSNLKKAIKSGVIDEEVRLLINDEIKWIRVFGNVQSDTNNKPSTIIAAAVDIGHHKILLQNIKLSEDRFRKIADTTPMNIWIANKEAAYTYINKTWLDYTGSKLEDNLGDKWINFVHKEDKDECMETYKEAFNNKEPYSFEFRVKKHDGTYQWFLNHGIPKFDVNNTFRGYLGSSTNIHKQIEFSDMLEEKVDQRTKEITHANENLVELNINLEEYAYMVSHDLREPLRKIRIFNSLINSKDADAESILKYATKIEHSAERMTDLINNILEYSKIEDNVIKYESVDLNDIFKQVLSDLTIIIEEQHAQINVVELGNIQGIPIRIYQLFSNLIKNAIKFNDNKPLIEITISEIAGKNMPKHLKSKEDAIFKKIVFKDNGIGIDMNKKDYIFKPFKKLNASSKFAGTGIGLAICKRIMEFHNGCIDVESKIGKGSSFILYFPVK